MKGSPISYEYLIEDIHYDPETGIFTSRKTMEKIGRVFNKSGYKVIILYLTRCRKNYKAVPAHRIAWLYMTGEWPNFEIDHINRDGTDNRWVNLRNGSGINKRNLSRSKKNKSGVTGVSWDSRRSKWRAVGHYTDDDKKYRQKFLGYFSDIDSASKRVSLFRKDNNYDPFHGLPRPITSQK